MQQERGVAGFGRAVPGRPSRRARPDAETACGTGPFQGENGDPELGRRARRHGVGIRLDDQRPSGEALEALAKLPLPQSWMERCGGGRGRNRHEGSRRVGSVAQHERHRIAASYPATAEHLGSRAQEIPKLSVACRFAALVLQGGATGGMRGQEIRDCRGIRRAF